MSENPFHHTAHLSRLKKKFELSYIRFIPLLWRFSFAAFIKKQRSAFHCYLSQLLSPWFRL